MDHPISIDYRLLVDNLATAILLVDSKLNIFYLNSSCEALFDISLLRASGQPALNLLQHPAHGAIVINYPYFISRHGLTPKVYIS